MSGGQCGQRQGAEGLLRYRGINTGVLEELCGPDVSLGHENKL